MLECISVELCIVIEIIRIGEKVVIAAENVTAADVRTW